MGGGVCPPSLIIIGILCAVGAQVGLRRLRQSNFQSPLKSRLIKCLFPATAPVVQISAASIRFAGRVNPDLPVRRPDQPHQLPLGLNRAAAHAGSLGEVLNALRLDHARKDIRQKPGS